MCSLRVILCRHLTDFAVSSRLDQEYVPHLFHLMFSDIPEQMKQSRPRSGGTAASRTTVQNPKTPLRGKEILTPSPRRKDRPRTASTFPEDPDCVP